MLGLFLPAALWVSWEVLCGNSWSLASGPDSLGWNGVGTQQGFVLVSAFLMLPALKLDTSVSLICRASPWAAAVWVKMCLPLLAQRNSLFCCLSLCSLKLQGVGSWRSFWLSVGANALLKFKCVWGLIPRFTELIREKTSNDFSNLLEPVYNKVVAGRMWTSAVLGRPTEQKGLFSDMQQGEGRAVLPSLCSLGMVFGSHAPIVFMLIDILVLSWVDDSRGLWQ